MKIVGKIEKIIAELTQRIDEFDTDKLYTLQVKELKDKRSIDQNNYYWELLTQYASYERVSKIKMHRMIIAHYGTIASQLLVKTPSDYDYTEETDHIYLRPTGMFFEDNGEKYQWHQICKGSSELDTKEMSILIDGLIQDIKTSEAPIDTMTFDERARLWGIWQ